jgi:UDP:flavonoid glycosyltransferase YjiC (YdhE family)
VSRVFLGAFGDPGHAFPIIALGRRLVERGHEVTLQTWSKWRSHVEDGGMRFEPAAEYQVFPTKGRALKPYEAAVRAAQEDCELVRAFGPDVLVHDILTLAPALAGELEDVPVATLIPHVFPMAASGQPPYSLGARLPRTGLGRRFWTALEKPMSNGLEQGRAQLNESRRRLGLPALDWVHGGLARRLTMVGTLPQLEYPRTWPAWAQVVGPVMWEPPFGDVDLPPGDAPLVLVAPSTSQDPSHRLLRAAVEGLADLPVRVLATWNRRPLDREIAVPANTRLVEWVSYSRTMPACDVVVCHGGHGTVLRALTSGCSVVAVPAGGDMGENAARLDWSGLGVRLPQRLLSPATVGLAVERALADGAMRSRVRSVAAWASRNDGSTRAAEAVEGLAGQPADPPLTARPTSP